MCPSRYDIFEVCRGPKQGLPRGRRICRFKCKRKGPASGMNLDSRSRQGKSREHPRHRAATRREAQDTRQCEQTDV